MNKTAAELGYICVTRRAIQTMKREVWRQRTNVVSSHLETSVELIEQLRQEMKRRRTMGRQRSSSDQPSITDCIIWYTIAAMRTTNRPVNQTIDTGTIQPGTMNEKRRKRQQQN